MLKNAGDLISDLSIYSEPTFLYLSLCLPKHFIAPKKWLWPCKLEDLRQKMTQDGQIVHVEDLIKQRLKERRQKF